MKLIFLVGRVLFSLIFIIKPLEHFTGQLVVFANSMGVPMANISVPLWGIVGLIGGLSVLLGFRAKIGAWLIVVFLLPLTFYMHPFWSFATFFAETMHGYCFWKNISLIGAALMITYFGSGPMSLDGAGQQQQK